MSAFWTQKIFKNGPKMTQNVPKIGLYIAVIAVTTIAVGNIAVTPIAVFGIPTAMWHVYTTHTNKDRNVIS